MAGPIQKAIMETAGAGAALAIGAKKEHEAQRQISKAASAEATNKAALEAETEKEARETAIEADLIRMGADPESARSFMVARSLGLDTGSFGMVRSKGKFVGSYSALAEKLSKDALTDTLSSRAINDKGFRDRLMALGSSRRGRVDALVKASKGGEK